MIKPKPDRYAGLIKSDEELQAMRKAGRELARVREEVVRAVRPGVSTLELDRLARKRIEELGARPAFLGYNDYPATLCTSINEEVVHGIPNAKRRLSAGDLVSIDFGLILHGFYADTAVTVPVGELSEERKRLIEVTRRALEVGIAAVRVDGRVGDISAAIQRFVESQSMTVVRDYTGHGIGREMHEEPKVPNYGKEGHGLRLRAGMVVALEPMVNLGTWRTEVLEDGWTVVTADGRPSAHFEHTVALTASGVEILTA